MRKWFSFPSQVFFFFLLCEVSRTICIPFNTTYLLLLPSLTEYSIVWTWVELMFAQMEQIFKDLNLLSSLNSLQWLMLYSLYIFVFFVCIISSIFRREIAFNCCAFCWCRNYYCMWMCICVYIIILRFYIFFFLISLFASYIFFS